MDRLTDSKSAAKSETKTHGEGNVKIDSSYNGASIRANQQIANGWGKASSSSGSVEITTNSNTAEFASKQMIANAEPVSKKREK